MNINSTTSTKVLGTCLTAIATVFMINIATPDTVYAFGGGNSNINNNFNMNKSFSETYSNSYSSNSSSLKNDVVNESSEPAIAPNLSGLVATPTTCMGSTSASGAGGGVFSFGLGTTYRDKECEKREAVKLAAQLGLNDKAVRIFMTLDVVRELDHDATSQQNVQANSVVINNDSDRHVALNETTTGDQYLLHMFRW